MQRICFFDSHFHIIDPRFPVIANNNYLPPTFTITDYYQRLSKFNLLGGVVVSGSFQGFDQSYLLTCLEELGPRFVGVTQLPSSISDAEILDLNNAGIRGIRFNLKRGGSEDIAHLESFAKRVHEIAGWHVELYIDARELADLVPVLIRLPAVSIDHLGLTKEGLPTLFSLLDHDIKIKATGFGRVNFAVINVLQEISHINPDALMFGTDLPSTRAPRPFSDADVSLIHDNIDEAMAEKIFYLNALEFYRLKTV